MGKLLRSGAYRLVSSRIYLIIFVCLVFFGTIMSVGGDMYDPDSLRQAIEEEPYTFVRLQNAYGLQDAATEEELMAGLYPRQFPLVFENVAFIMLLFGTALPIAFLSRDFQRARMQREQLYYSRAQSLFSRLILLLCATLILPVVPLVYHLVTYTIPTTYTLALLLRNIVLFYLILMGQVLFSAFWYVLLPNAPLGFPAALVSSFVLLFLSQSAPLCPAAALFQTRFWTASASTGQLLLYAALSLGYMILFSLLSYLIFRRKKLK